MLIITEEIKNSHTQKFVQKLSFVKAKHTKNLPQILKIYKYVYFISGIRYMIHSRIHF